MLTRGLHALTEALRHGELGDAVRQADELDRAVGPHIAFEERVYYPQLRRVLGDAFVQKLYGEHTVGVHAVQHLIAHDPACPLDAAETERLLDDLETAFEHAKSCGTLLSHLEHLPEEAQHRMLEQLEAMRTSGVRWTEVSTRRIERR